MRLFHLRGTLECDLRSKPVLLFLEKRAAESGVDRKRVRVAESCWYSSIAVCVLVVEQGRDNRKPTRVLSKDVLLVTSYSNSRAEMKGKKIRKRSGDKRNYYNLTIVPFFEIKMKLLWK